MVEIIIADNHEQVYPVWSERGIQGAKLTHVDFHCDMRGIMIDRKCGSAYFTSHRESTFIDRGNFLAHAIMNGIIGDLRWVHGPKGGRAFDIGPVVSYETDFLAKFHAYNHKRSGRPEVKFEFDECLLSKWSGMRKQEILDLDWDAFASIEYDASHREELIDLFFSRDFTHIPELTTLIYSPGYSDPDRTLFDNFAERLADVFNAEVVRLPHAALNVEGESKSRLRKLVKQFAPPQIRNVKRGLSRTWRQMESARDLEAYK